MGKGRLPGAPPWPGPPPLLPPRRLELAVRPPLLTILTIVTIVPSHVTNVFVHHRNVATDVSRALAKVPDPQPEIVELPPDAPGSPVLTVHLLQFLQPRRQDRRPPPKLLNPPCSAHHHNLHSLCNALVIWRRYQLCSDRLPSFTCLLSCGDNNFLFWLDAWFQKHIYWRHITDWRLKPTPPPPAPAPPRPSSLPSWPPPPTPAP